MKILIVDDENIIRMGIKTVIERSGRDWNIIGEAIDGVDALEQIECYKPNVIITDIRMPEIDGIELSKIVSVKYPDILVIVISGYAEFEYAKEAVKFGAVDYLLKPTKPEDLIESLEKAEGIIRKKIVKSQEEEKLRFELEQLRNDAKFGGFQTKNIPEIEDVNSAQKYRKIIELAVEFINNNYSHDITLKQIAEVLYMNPNYLCDLFRQETGIHFSNYITQIRINNAKELLTTRAELRSYEIAELVGYKDAKYFTQVFKKQVGVTPTEYRENKY
ncbi:MAG TPA: response regulator [Ruminiclostridium sp.]